MRFVTCVVLASLFAINAIADERTTVIHAGTLLAVPGNAAQSNQSIIIEGTQIARVENGFIDSADISGEVTVIDLSTGSELADGCVARHDLDAGAEGRDARKAHIGRGIYNGTRSWWQA
jgi:hypothetical protein